MNFPVSLIFICDALSYKNLALTYRIFNYQIINKSIILNSATKSHLIIKLKLAMFLWNIA